MGTVEQMKKLLNIRGKKESIVNNEVQLREGHVKRDVHL